MTDLLPITDAEIIAELERELRERARVYPRQIEKRRLTRERADRQCALLRAAVTRLYSLSGEARVEPSQPSSGSESAPEGLGAVVDAVDENLRRGGLRIVEIGAETACGAQIRARLPATGTVAHRTDAALEGLREACRTVRRIRAGDRLIED